MELKSHFHNEAYKQNLTTTANKSLSDIKYYEERRNFLLETYYNIMTKNFKLLELAGTAHLLSEEQKIIKFEAGLKEDRAINYSINSKSIWYRLLENQQTFDSYSNTFPSFMNKHNFLEYGNHRKVQIAQTRSERYNPSRARSKYSRQYSSGGRGCGPGRGGMQPRMYNPYAMVWNTRGNFKPEAKIFSKEEYSNLGPAQRNQVHELKLKNGWSDGHTPPPGFQINENWRNRTHFPACVHHHGNYN